MNPSHEIFEQVKAVKYSIGDKCDETFANFIQILALSYSEKYQNVKVEKVTHDSFKVEGKVNIPARAEEPYRVRKCQPNHKILNEEWTRKKAEEIEEETEKFIKQFKEKKPWNDVFEDGLKRQQTKVVEAPDRTLCLFSLKDPANNLAFEKTAEPEYDAQSFAVYKVGLDERSDYIEMKTRSTRHTNFVSTMKEKYHITFHEL